MLMASVEERVAPILRASSKARVVAHHARRALFDAGGFQADDGFQFWQARGGEPARCAIRKLRRQRLEHAKVVRRLEFHRRDQGRAANLVERIFQFMQAVGRVDVDEDRADACCRKQGQHPFDPVRRPNADSVTGLHSDGQKACRKPVRRVTQFSPGQTYALFAEHDGCFCRPFRSGFIEQRGNRDVAQGRLGCANDMREAFDRFHRCGCFRFCTGGLALTALPCRLRLLSTQSTPIRRHAPAAGV
jgi:hypothetical protein